MHIGFLHKKSITPYIAAFCSGMLLLSFGLHSVQVKHVHPGAAHAATVSHTGAVAQTNHAVTNAHGEHPAEEEVISIAEYMHSSEKKSFLYVLFSLILAGAYLCHSLVRYPQVLCTLVSLLYARSKTRRALCVRAFCFLQHFLSAGIMHPKLYSA